MSVDQLWHSTKKEHSIRSCEYEITYDWFILALSMLYEIGGIMFVDGKIVGVTL